jgi:hypothetical protein
MAAAAVPHESTCQHPKATVRIAPRSAQGGDDLARGRHPAFTARVCHPHPSPPPLAPSRSAQSLSSGPVTHSGDEILRAAAWDVTCDRAMGMPQAPPPPSWRVVAVGSSDTPSHLLPARICHRSSVPFLLPAHGSPRERSSAGGRPPPTHSTSRGVRIGRVRQPIYLASKVSPVRMAPTTENKAEEKKTSSPSAHQAQGETRQGGEGGTRGNRQPIGLEYTTPYTGPDQTRPDHDMTKHDRTARPPARTKLLQDSVRLTGYRHTLTEKRRPKRGGNS